ncbi:HSP20-like chaperone [Pholiota conissans]|uniref:HSP20-like chaperone n=1 Tax=Pholiota conissans TaxID=109636 RepID=A0A9P5ZD48_9AGAR|nr:HSP20-like chaperone [Pholiota conissans]
MSNADRVLDNALNARSGVASNDEALQHRALGGGDTAVRTLKPRMDLLEYHDKNTVTAIFELPGLKKEDVQIDLHDNRMTVSGESSTSNGRDEGEYAVRERSFGKFSRTLQLPQGVKEDQIKAHLDNGVLCVQFP